MAKYFLDKDLRFKRVRLTISQKLIRIFLFLIISLALGALYNFAYYKAFGSVKEKQLERKLEESKLNYILLENRFEYIRNELSDLQSSDESYRNILDLTYLDYNSYDRTDKDYEEFNDFAYPEIIIPMYKTYDTIMYLVEKLETSFYELNTETQKGIHRIDHLPYISPVNIAIRRGEGIKFREVHPILGYPTWHHGQDFSAPLGTPVHATGAGKIIYIGYDKGFGNFVKIDHGYGFQTIYGHLSKFNVKVGQDVKRGDIIAYSGNTGYSTGPHLHYEIHLYGRYQNPLHFFGDNLSEDEYIAMIDTLNQLLKK